MPNGRSLSGNNLLVEAEPGPEVSLGLVGSYPPNAK